MSNAFCMLAIAFGSLLISSAIAYLFWIKIRELRLSADLLESVQSLDSEMKELGTLCDPAYQHTRCAIKSIADVPDVFSWPVMFYVLATEYSGNETPKSPDARVRALVAKTQSFAGARIAEYMFYESLLAWIFRVIAPILPKKEARRAVRSSVRHTFEPLASCAHTHCFGGM